MTHSTLQAIQELEALKDKIEAMAIAADDPNSHLWDWVMRLGDALAMLHTGGAR